MRDVVHLILYFLGENFKYSVNDNVSSFCAVREMRTSYFVLFLGENFEYSVNDSSFWNITCNTAFNVSSFCAVREMRTLYFVLGKNLNIL